MRRCFLHVGGYKTGSTALQAALAGARADLGAEGVLYPKAGTDPGGRHLPLTRALVSPHSQPRLAAVPARFRRELLSSPCDTVVLSTETLENGPVPLRALVDLLGSLNCAVTIVLYVRHQIQRINSAYVQRVKGMFDNIGMEEHLLLTLSVNDLFYHRWIALAERLGCRLIVRPYRSDPAFDLAGDFLRAIGVAPVTSTLGRVVNAAVSPVGLAASRVIMRRLDTHRRVLDVRSRNAVTEHLATLDRELGEPSYFGLDPDAVAMLNERFAGDNDALAARLWSCRWADHFADDIAQVRAVNALPADADGKYADERVIRLVRKTWPFALRLSAERGEDAARYTPTPQAIRAWMLEGRG